MWQHLAGQLCFLALNSFALATGKSLSPRAENPPDGRKNRRRKSSGEPRRTAAEAADLSAERTCASPDGMEWHTWKSGKQIKQRNPDVLLFASR